MTGNGNIPYICYFQLSCFSKENSKQSDHAGPAAASLFKKSVWAYYVFIGVIADVVFLQL